MTTLACLALLAAAHDLLPSCVPPSAPAMVTR